MAKLEVVEMFAMPNLAKDIGKCQQALNVIIVPHDIQDRENAAQLHVTQGRISFRDVCLEKMKFYALINKVVF